MNSVASRVLYAKISVSSRSDVDILRDLCNGEALRLYGWSIGGALQIPQRALISSCLPQYTDYVEEFEVTALIFPETSQRDILRSLDLVLIKYANLHSFVWQPPFCDTELTIGVARLLPRLSGLKKLSIRVPFSLPPIPKAPSPVQASQNLDVITEEDEEENQEDVHENSASAPLSGENEVYADSNDEEDSVPYEYKPLEDDPNDPSPTKSSLPYYIPPKELRRLRTLVLTSPTNDVLMNLPETLYALERPIRSLRFEGNCGPVTPGTLTSLVPVLQGAEYFGLGLTYSIKYEELIPFLDRLPKLRKLEIFHYHQLYTRASPFARLQSLKHLKVRHSHTNSRIQAVKMCVWIRRLISASCLEELEVVCENSDSQQCPPRGPGHGIRYDGLIEHLSARHRETLRVLRMPGSYLSKRSISKLLGKDGKGYNMIEELKLCNGTLSHLSLKESLGDLLDSASRMRLICLNVINLKRDTTLRVDESILKGGGTHLCSVIVNGRGYRGEWTADLGYDDPIQPKLKAVFRISEIVERKMS
ncbi:hypothetical protein ACEPAH_2517 [Sanghuangporus vaninii]